jgi:hypothetical protein
MPRPLTEEEFKAALPAHVKKSVSKELINGINKVLADPHCLDFLRDNILGYTKVMKEGKFKIIQYLNAVHYVSHKLMGASNRDAYLKTFPDKYQRFLSTGVSEKDISSYASAYNKSKLVNLIFEQTLIPTYILNAPLYQEALNVQAELMLNAKSEMVRSQAASSILSELRMPETQKVELDIGVKQDSTLERLRESTLELVEAQKRHLKAQTLTVKELGAKPLAIVHDAD